MISVKREIKKLLINKIQANKVIILIGPRRVGKTYLLKEIKEELADLCLMLNGEDINTHRMLENQSIENYHQLLGNRRTLIIDEAQKIPGIGNKLKLMVDEIPGLKVIITGSSAFEVDNTSGEPLTGRKYTYTLFPLSVRELLPMENDLAHFDQMEERLVLGSYPELLHLGDRNDKLDYLNDMLSSYLLKDILIYENIKNAQKIHNLLRMIAFQLGHEVSYQELGNQLSISKNTVEKYLDILCKMYLIYKVEGFSRNLRKEITKNSRYYFYDNGVRNAVIANFNPINERNDKGQLWENYLIAERLKMQQYKRIYANNFFWRTYSQQEIDWVEEREGKLFAYEFKWKKAHVKIPPQWQKAYPDAVFEIIIPENYLNWLG